MIIVSLADLWTSLSDHRYAYLALAVVVAAVALRSVRRALAPIGPIVHALAAIAGVAFAVGMAVVVLFAVVVSGT
ncbi:hypothetical protein SAMN05421812_116124 [Asanoa hainanensis]|uniref:Uncharacterized protein n=1 Tax=Asanoa hainanensis TaxID=560556 RepID=A0A239PAR6_9ACTN|nr:hypothetical protein SAMN05421812_116124 [Asanoa hainanensis]